LGHRGSRSGGRQRPLPPRRRDGASDVDHPARAETPGTSEPIAPGGGGTHAGSVSRSSVVPAGGERQGDTEKGRQGEHQAAPPPGILRVYSSPCPERSVLADRESIPAKADHTRRLDLQMANSATPDRTT